jgi:hypothetical protein
VPAELAEISAETSELLAEVLDWRLAPDGWRVVDGLLGAIEDSLARSDAGELAAVTAEIEVLGGPSRIIPVGDPSDPGAPPRSVRDRLNRLVHQLGGVTATGEPAAAVQPSQKRSDDDD